MIKIFHLLSDYSREPAVEVNTLDEARTWCRNDGSRMFWPQPNGELVSANKEREAIHVIVSPTEVVTCGICKRSWDEAQDPAPSALCHWCHGRGYSTAPITKSE